MLITCSDSRVSPTLITQAAPGDLFVLRNAGNLVPPYGAAALSGEAATVEFAVASLGVRDIVVLGHSNCGAMQGLLAPESCGHLPAMQAWLQLAESTRRILRETYAELEGEARLAKAIEVHVMVQLANLRTHPCVAARLAAGDLKLHGWVYDIGTGVVAAYDSEEGRFSPMTDEQPSTPAEAESAVEHGGTQDRGLVG